MRGVKIDIKPGNNRNSINPFGKGVIPVAILGSDTFDVADVDVTTLVFGPNGASLAHRKGPHPKDANHDGFTDLLAHFLTEQTGIAPGDEEACVTSETLDGAPFKGCDSVRTVPPIGAVKVPEPLTNLLQLAALGTLALLRRRTSKSRCGTIDSTVCGE